MEHHHDSLLADPRFWISVSFVIFCVLFGRRIWVSLTGILDKRALAIRTELDEAARLRREAETMLAAARTEREQALKQAEAMLAQAREEAARLAEAARGEAASTARRREQMAMDRISAAEKAALNDVRLAAADIATRAAGEVLRHGFGADADAALIDRAIQGLPSALAGRRAA